MKSTINLSNSIIGVAILSMPLCFKQCGIILSIVLLATSVILNQFSCYLLFKSAIINRRRNYELLAFDVFGSSGKTVVEISILLFLIGTCIAFFVIVGDIGPSLVAHILNIDNGPHLRALVLTMLAMFVIFPLGLLRNVENLTSFSMLSLIVYLFLALRMVTLAFDKILSPSSLNILHEVNYWNSSYTISYLPIFAMALACQSQIFEIFNSDLFQAEVRSLKHIMRSIRRALYICCLVYIFIGFFAYMAFYDTNLTGNILQSLPSGLLTKLTLLLFLVTLLTSFPLCLFPCRTSLHSLLFRKGGYNDFLSTAHSIHMSDFHFKLLTIVLIVTTMGISVIFPHVELVLALVGSTIGTIICFIFPALIFIKICDRNTVEYLLSYLLLLFGVVMLIFCTFSALHNISVARNVEVEEKIIEIMQKPSVSPQPHIAPTNKFESLAIHPTELKSRINNINKLKQSIQIDMNKLKKQEEILQRLEKQQQEHSKILKEQREIINELKTQQLNDSKPAVNESNVITVKVSMITKSPAPAPPLPLAPEGKPEPPKAAPGMINKSNSFVINRSEQLNKMNKSKEPEKPPNVIVAPESKLVEQPVAALVLPEVKKEPETPKVFDNSSIASLAPKAEAKKVVKEESL